MDSSNAALGDLSFQINDFTTINFEVINFCLAILSELWEDKKISKDLHQMPTFSVSAHAGAEHYVCSGV